MTSICASLNPLIPLKSQPEICAKSLSIATLLSRERRLAVQISCTRLDDSTPNNSTNQQFNVSVLRFTFGIPGLDESYLPRWIGFAFGWLLLLNHFLGSDSTTVTSAQLRTEVLGLSLAAFSVVVPYLGKFLKGSTAITEKVIPEDAEQIFSMSKNISDILKGNLAWGTYVLLRNTNTISVLISIQDAKCVRGYWSTPKDLSEDQIEDWFEKQVQRIGLLNLKETLYFPLAAESELWGMLPKGTRSLLVQPIIQVQNSSSSESDKSEGFVLLASTSSYAYSNKDSAWIGAVANKFRVNQETRGFAFQRNCLALFLDEVILHVGHSTELQNATASRSTQVIHKNFSKPYTRFCQEKNKKGPFQRG